MGDETSGMEVDPNLGYVALGALIGAESTGVPVPGETALLAAAVLAGRGDLDIELVVAVAATAAIVGDNLGYWIGRKGGRRLFELRGPLHGHRQAALARGEDFFARHGPKAVFLGRWIAWLRITSAWLAGITEMRWPTFLLWNALGGVAWATSVGLLAYMLGPAVEEIFKVGGIVALSLAALALVAFAIVRWRRAARAPES
jgi:membrane-associated protein